MFPWYVDAGLALGVLGVYCSIWSVIGRSWSVHPQTLNPSPHRAAPPPLRRGRATSAGD